MSTPEGQRRAARMRAVELGEGARTTLRHGLGSPILFAFVYTRWQARSSSRSES